MVPHRNPIRSPRRSRDKFIAFVNEEPPFFARENMGSFVYAKAAAAKKDDIKAALILEMIGYFSERPLSQRYPPLIGPFFPDKGDFLAQVGNFSSRMREIRPSGWGC